MRGAEITRANTVTDFIQQFNTVMHSDVQEQHFTSTWQSVSLLGSRRFQLPQAVKNLPLFPVTVYTFQFDVATTIYRVSNQA